MESEIRITLPQKSSDLFLRLYRPHTSSTQELNNIGVALLLLFFIILALLNALCIYQVCRRRKLRPIDYLLINMSFSVIGFCCIGTVTQVNLIDFLPISPQARCSLTNYCKYLAISLISTASFAVSYERLSSLRTAQRRRKYTLSTTKLVSLVWTVALGIILPTTMTSVPSPEPLLNANSSKSLCWRVPLFYSRFMDIWYEVVRYLFLHLAFTVCVFSELYMVRSKLKYICMNQAGKMKAKINRVRCAFIQSVLFVILWNIFGICNVIYTIATWYSSKSFVVINTTIGIIKGIGYIYTVVNPILLFYSNQSRNKSCMGSYCLFQCLCCANNNVENNSAQSATSSNPDISRFSTRMQDTCGIIPQSDKMEEDEAETSLEKTLSQNPETNTKQPRVEMKSIEEPENLDPPQPLHM